MKILYRGTDPVEIDYIGICGRCRTQAVFKRKEAKEVRGDQRDPSYLSVKCPVCENGNIVSAFVKYVPPMDVPCIM